MLLRIDEKHKGVYYKGVIRNGIISAGAQLCKKTSIYRGDMGHFICDMCSEHLTAVLSENFI